MKAFKTLQDQNMVVNTYIKKTVQPSGFLFRFFVFLVNAFVINFQYIGC